MKYSVLLFDLVDSRELLKRKTTQELLIESTTYLNKMFEKSLKRNVEFTTGDELQGLFFKVEAAYFYYRLLEMLIYPIKIRIGISKGTLDLYDEDWNTNKLDGKCYHYAREAIELAKENNLDMIYYSNSLNDKKINTYFQSLFLIKKPLTFLAYMNSLLLELFFPLYDEEIFMLKDYIELKKIIELKYQLIDNKYEIIDFQSLLNFEYDKRILVNYSDIIKKTEVVVTDFFKNGYAGRVAAILQTSRQNVTKQFNIHNTAMIRNIEAAVLFELKEENDYD